MCIGITTIFRLLIVAGGNYNIPQKVAAGLHFYLRVCELSSRHQIFQQLPTRIHDEGTSAVPNMAAVGETHVYIVGVKSRFNKSWLVGEKKRSGLLLRSYFDFTTFRFGRSAIISQRQRWIRTEW